MRFKGETVTCEGCGREISEEDDQGYEDTPLCSGCSAREYQIYLKIPCALCGKPMGENADPWCNIDEEYAHDKCIKKLTDEQVEEAEWYNLADVM